MIINRFLITMWIADLPVQGFWGDNYGTTNGPPIHMHHAWGIKMDAIWVPYFVNGARSEYLYTIPENHIMDTKRGQGFVGRIHLTVELIDI